MTHISGTVIFPSLWRAQECNNPEQAHPGLWKHLCPPMYPFLLTATGAMWTTTRWLQPAPDGSLSKRGAREHKNAAVYFYCSPFSFSSICLPYVYTMLLGSCSHRPFIMRVASLTKIKNVNSPLLVTRGLNSFKYVIRLVFKLEQTNHLFSSSCPWNLFYFYIYDISFHFSNKKPHGGFSVVFSPRAGPPYCIHINL